MALRVALEHATVQTYAAQQIAQFLQAKTGQQYAIERVDFSFFNTLHVEGVRFGGKNQDTLAYVGTLKASLTDLSFANELTITINNIEIQDGRFYIVKEVGDVASNLSMWLASLNLSESSNASAHFYLKCGEFTLSNCAFIYRDMNSEPPVHGLDWENLHFTDLNASFKDVLIINDSVNAEIDYLMASEQVSGLELHKLAGSAVYSSHETHLLQGEIDLGTSNLNLDLNFAYDSAMSYAHFIDAVSMNVDFYQSKLNLADLAFFVEDLWGMDSEVLLSGHASGRIKNLSLDDLELSLGNETRFAGNIDLNGLPNIAETFIQVDLTEFTTSSYDIGAFKLPSNQIINSIALPAEFSRAGKVGFQGSFTGFVNDFVAYGTFFSDLGKVKSDLQLKRSSSGQLAYKGSVSSRQFNLGKLLESEQLNRLDFDVQLNGSGIELENLTAEVSGQLKQIDFNGYRYQVVNLTSQVNKKVFTGQVGIVDPNITFDFQGKVDLSQSLPAFEYSATIDSMRLGMLNLYEMDSSAVFKTQMYANFRGNSLNNVIGRANLTDLQILQNGEKSTLKKVEFTAYGTPEGKTIILETDHIDAFIAGKFNTAKLPATLNYLGSQIAPSYYEVKPDKPKAREVFELNVSIDGVSSLGSFFVPGLDIGSDFSATCAFDSDQDEVHLSARGNQLSYFNLKSDTLTVEVDVVDGRVDVLAEVPELFVSDSLSVKDYQLKLVAIQDYILLHNKWSKDHNGNNYAGDINLTAHVIGKEEVDIRVLQSEFYLADSLWQINPNSLVSLRGDSVHFEHVEIRSGNQLLSLNGDLSHDSTSILSLNLNALELASFNAFTFSNGIELSGTVDGSTQFENTYNDLIINSSNTFSQFFFNDQQVGSGKISSIYDSENERITVEGSMGYDSLKTLDISGLYYPLKDSNSLNLNLGFEALKVKMAEPFLAGVIDKMKGAISGSFNILGTPQTPLVKGSFITDKVGMRVDYLKTSYTLDKQVFRFEPEWIGADAIDVVDEQGRIAKLNLSVLHSNYTNFNYDIYLFNLKRFMALNTVEDDNELFYGKAFVSGFVDIAGNDNDVSIEATLKTEPNTVLAIPLGGPEEVEDIPFISFVTPQTDSIAGSQVSETPAETQLSSINMVFDLEVTPDATVEIIFDRTVGDIISAQGAGDLRLEVLSNGDFNMYGTYEVFTGDYLFTLQNVINKRFKIQDGGQIVWNGDPFEATIDMVAEYKTRTSVYNLNIPTGLDSNAVKQRIPVSVLLKLENIYTNPDFSFAFEMPTTYTEVQGILNNLEKGELNKQVFTILMLNSFIPVDGGTGGTATSNALGKSSSELLSNQLSNWLSQISSDFDIGVNYRPGDAITSDEVEVALSTQLFNDRVIIEGNFEVQGDNPNDAQQNNNQGVAGDFNVEYKISQDGKFRGKAYNRSNTYDVTSVNQAPYTQGVGVLYREEFNTFSGLWCRFSQRFKKKENRDLEACRVQEQELLLKRQIAREARKEEQENSDPPN